MIVAHINLRRCLLAAVIVMLTPAASMATVYECTTKQALQWTKGSLVPDNNRFSRKHEALRFDDEAGVLWVAYDESNPFAPIHLKVVQKISQNSDLIALSTANHGNFMESEIFRIRTWENSATMSFLYYSSGHEITTGQCHIGEGYP